MSAGTKVAIAVTVLFVLVLGVYYGFSGPIGRPGSDAAEMLPEELPAPPVRQVEVQPSQGILSAAVGQSAGEPMEEPAGVFASEALRPALQQPPAPARSASESAFAFGPVAVPVEGYSPGPQNAGARPAARDDVLPGPEYVEYVVQEDDSLWTIAAEQLGDSSRWSLIAEANPSIKPDRLRVGQKLRLPGAPGRVGLNRSAEIAKAPGAEAPSNYVVRSGDTLSTIAERVYRDGGRWRRIYEANRALIGADPDRLDVGMTLRIP